MNEFVTERAARPASSEHRFVPIEIFSAYSAQAGLNPEHHRLPFPATFSNTHKRSSIAGRSSEKQVRGKPMLGLHGLGDFELHGEVKQNSQCRSSLRMSRNAFSAETVLVAFRLQAEKRISASATHAASTAVSGSSCISTSNRSANRSRSVAESLRACFSSANARAVIGIHRSETTLDNGNCTRFHTYAQRHGRLPIRQSAPSPTQWREPIETTGLKLPRHRAQSHLTACTDQDGIPTLSRSRQEKERHIAKEWQFDHLSLLGYSGR